jgi:uncharacterized membrane protein YvlD (DUF360 family)
VSDRPSDEPARNWLRRAGAVLVVSALSLAGAVWILPGLSLTGWGAGIATLAVLGLLNGVGWPFVMRFAAPLVFWTAGTIGLFANALVLSVTAHVVDGFDVAGFWWAVFGSLVMTGFSVFVAGLLAVDDDEVWRRNTMRRMVGRRESPDTTDVPGVLFLQIDGLSAPVLRQAVRDGYAPTLARWIRSGSHRVVEWECDLSSQTGASQAGILLGDNADMPAFRWYDKQTGRVVTTNRPQDAAEIERLRSDGTGLLVDGGVSRANVFSGDSTDSMFTFSTVVVRSPTQNRTNALTYVFSDPYFFSRLLVLGIADIGHEIRARRRARRRRVEPRLERTGTYPLLRAATTVLLRDLTVATLMSDVYRGVPVGYVDFVGYDEVAHHSGIAAPDALEVLLRLDHQFRRLERAIAGAPRPYHLVALSDHGQSQGSTFLQRYGVTLSGLVASLVDDHTSIRAPRLSSEGWGNLNGALTDVVNDENSRAAQVVAAIVGRRTVGGEVALGPADSPSRSDTAGDAGVVVLASGNLGLISFPDIDGRASIEDLAVRFPGLVAGLAAHPGIGFVMVRSELFGPMVIGSQGVHYLDDERVEGTDPLAVFGPNIVHHLRRTDSFSNAPDILVNSFYDPDSDEGAAFEELIGFHGGVGGSQTRPFILAPSEFPLPDEPVVGAEAVHVILKQWRALVSSAAAPDPWGVPERPGPTIEPPARPSGGSE